MYKQIFYKCPVCGSEEIKFDSIKKYECKACSWEYYHNTAAAVAAIIEYNEKVLVVVRNREPGKGVYDFPGGFIDPMESAENAQRREVKEELGIELSELKYLCSAPNIYFYKGIEVTTCDIFFTAKTETDILHIEESEIAGVHWLNREELDPSKFAFVSMQKAIEVYLKTYK